MKNKTAPAVRTVLITGGSRGIGAAIKTLLVARGYRVVAPSRPELNLADSLSVENYLSDHKKLPVDILINNAAINILANLTEIDGSVWQKMLQVNLHAPLRLIQNFSLGMKERGWGRILNIGSVLGLVAKPYRSAYSTTKAALHALTRSAAIEMGPSGVLVNSLSPGYVDTELTHQNNSAEEIAKIISTIPLHRLAKVEELAHVAAFLVSEENTYLTGQNIVVDGGFICQ